MREIKFRAWDKKARQWLFDYERTSLGGFSMFGEVMLMGEYASLISRRIGDIENIVLMQFTGLKDKNGVEIYEGDIVRYYSEEIEDSEGNLDPDYVFTDEVKWHPEGGWLCAHDLGWDYSPLLGCEELRTEVIGNVHQNPELLQSPTHTEKQ